MKYGVIIFENGCESLTYLLRIGNIMYFLCRIYTHTLSIIRMSIRVCLNNQCPIVNKEIRMLQIDFGALLLSIIDSETQLFTRDVITELKKIVSLLYTNAPSWSPRVDSL